MIRLVTFMLAAMVVASSAHAGGYVGAYGGINWDDVISSPLVDSNAGFAVGGVLGMPVKSVPGLRVEADVSFRQNASDLLGGKIGVDHDTIAVLGNVAYDMGFATVGPAVPYILLGAGVARTQATFEDIALARLESTGFAWQAGIGINVNVADGAAIGFGYRYMQGPELEVLGLELSDGSNHALVAELHFGL